MRGCWSGGGEIVVLGGQVVVLGGKVAFVNGRRGDVLGRGLHGSGAVCGLFWWILRGQIAISWFGGDLLGGEVVVCGGEIVVRGREVVVLRGEVAVLRGLVGGLWDPVGGRGWYVGVLRAVQEIVASGGVGALGGALPQGE